MFKLSYIGVDQRVPIDRKRDSGFLASVLQKGMLAWRLALTLIFSLLHVSTLLIISLELAKSSLELEKPIIKDIYKQVQHPVTCGDVTASSRDAFRMRA